MQRSRSPPNELFISYLEKLEAKCRARDDKRSAILYVSGSLFVSFVC